MFKFDEVQQMISNISKQMNHPCPMVKINNRFTTRTMARASWGTVNKIELIELNKCVLNFQRHQLIDLIKHELMHLILRAGDNDPKFIQACRKAGISLNGDNRGLDTPQEAIKWKIVCVKCRETIARYKRLAGNAKKVMNHRESYGCPTCKAWGTLVVLSIEEELQ